MQDAEQPFDYGLTCLILIARFHQVAADGDQLRHHFAISGENFNDVTILHAARSLKLKSKHLQCNWKQLQKIHLPVITKDNSGVYFILAKLSDEGVLIQQADKQSPEIISKEKFEGSWCGEIILISRQTGLFNGNNEFNISWFIPAILKYKKYFIEVLIASFFIQVFALITPLFFQLVIDKVLVHHGLTTLDVLAIGLLLVSLFDVVLNGLRTYVFSHTSNRIDVTLGSKLFKHLLQLPIAYFESRRVGDTVARVRELDTIRNFITGSAITLVVDLFFTIVFITVLFFYSPTLSYVVLATLPCYAILALFITPILRTRLNDKFNRGAENHAFLVESVNGLETIKTAAIEPQIQRDWEDQLAGYVKANFKATNLGNIANQTASLINKIMIVLILWFGAKLVINGNLTVGQLVAFNMLSARVSGPVLRLLQLWQDFQQAGISIRRLGDILNTKTEPAYKPGRTSLPTLEGSVTFENITFRYHPDLPEVVKNISLSVPKGKTIGIVGRSGSGKSTLTKLLQRLHVPQQGRVLVDGVDLALVDTVWLRQNIGVVLQENYLFNRSIRENIALNDPSIAMERVVQAAKMSGAHNFILNLPQGYDNLVQENGSNLSGGQRQRIAIARAIITNPRILILDEATSALDYESEKIIHENMRYICKGRTVFIIAHRLNAVKEADQIIVMDKGNIIEGGNHLELINRNGFYRDMYKHQTA